MENKPAKPRAASPQKVKSTSQKITKEVASVHVRQKEPLLSGITYVSVGNENSTITNTGMALTNPHLLLLHLPIRTLRYLRTKNVNVITSIHFSFNFNDGTIMLIIYGDVNYSKTATYTFISCLLNLLPNGGLMKNGIEFCEGVVYIRMHLLQNKFINFLRQMCPVAVHRWECVITF